MLDNTKTKQSASCPLRVIPLYVTVPLTGLLLLSFTVKVAVVIVAASIASLKVAMRAALITTPVASALRFTSSSV